MFKRNTTRVVTLFAALLVATLVATGAAAAETTITDDSDFADDAELDGFNASADAHSILEIETDADEDTDALEVMFEAENETHLTLDDLDDAYAVEEDVENEDEELVDVHEFNVSHDEFEQVPGEANESTDLDVTIEREFEDADEEEVDETLELTSTLEFTNERTVLYITDDNLDDSDLGGDVDVSTEEFGFIASLTEDDDEFDIYDLDDSVGIDGDETTVHVFLNGDMADEFDDAVGDDTESEDAITGQTHLLDEDYTPVFLDEKDPDAVEAGEDSFVVHDGDELRYYIGEDYEDEDELNLRAANQPASDLDVEVEALGDVFGEASFASFSETVDAFGILGALDLRIDAFDLT